MIGVIINPGTGNVNQVAGTEVVPTAEQAMANMLVFARDCRATLKTIKRLSRRDYDREDGDGRFCFTMKKRSRNKRAYEIQMPGLPLDQVRYVGGEQNIWNYPRLYVDGNSWVWMFAVHQAGGPQKFGEPPKRREA